MYKLPNGKSTRSHKVYACEWERIAKPIEKALGMRLAGFDPSFLFLSQQNNRLDSLSLKTWQAIKLYKSTY